MASLIFERLVIAILLCAAPLDGCDSTRAAEAQPPTAPMVRIEAGAFERDGDAVRMSAAYWIGATEVTQAQWEAAMGTRHPSRFAGATRPVESVSWYEAVAFCNALSAKEGLRAAYRIEASELGGDRVVWDRSADGYRLPTEAEWEWAARADEGFAWSGAEQLDDAGWYHGNANGETHAVGGKQANRFGVKDATGNVTEWVFDPWSREPPSGTDPVAQGGEAVRTIRGGSFREDPEFEPETLLLLSERAGANAALRREDLGFRVARSTAAAPAPPALHCAPADLSALDGSALRLRRNLVFARRGRPFDDPAVRATFDREPWYHADAAYTDERLTAEDRDCIARIRRMEATRPTP